MQQYTKPPKKLEDQIELLKNRGLVIQNEAEAQEFLSRVNYYRFSAYCLPFEEMRHKFIRNTKFEQIVQLYNLDTQLRFALSKSLEIIENLLRAKIAYFFSLKYGTFFHEDSQYFFQSKSFNHKEWLDTVHKEIMRSREIFVDHYKNKYSGFPKMPLWMAVELMSFGSLSLMYNNLLKNDKIDFSKKLGNFHSDILSSWMHSFSYVRNICAHHGRIWNKGLGIKMQLPKAQEWKIIDNTKIAAVIFAINQFLQLTFVNSSLIECWKNEMETVLDSFIEIGFYREIGLPEDYKNHNLWK